MLLTPGPVPVPDFVQQALLKPVIPHRSATFEAFYTGLLEDLRSLFLTQHHVCTMIASGTGGVEAALSSLFRKGDTVLVVDNGKFSGRWADLGALRNWELARFSLPWGEVPRPEGVVERLQQLKAPTGLVLTHCETSTGALLDLEEIAYSVRQHFPEVCIVVDAITTVGALPFYCDDWGIDCAVVASQKALMNPAGVAAFALSETARERLQPTDPGDYNNLYNYLLWADKHNYPFTPPVSLLYGIKAALDHIHTQGLPAVWNRTHQAARTFRQELHQLGGKVFGESPSDSLTAFSFPGRDSESLRTSLKGKGYLLSGGQGKLKGHIMRVSHMGQADEKAMRDLLKVLGEELR